jgi:hypothetical protein
MFKVWMSLCGLLLLSGCASVLHSDVQQVKVTLLCKDQVLPATCVAQNARGNWHFLAPASIKVQKAMTPLSITCSSLYFPAITAVVPTEVNLSMAGNLLVGGLVGLGVDMYRGAGFAYNPDIRISYPACH